MRKKRILLVVMLSGLLFGACGIYSFTGTNISAGVKTIEIVFFQNKADLVHPTLSQIFTDALRDKFSSQTNLSLVDSQGDLFFEGYIKNYQIDPVAIQGDQTAAMNRLKVEVFVRFVNKIDQNQGFETPFSYYLDYPSEMALSQIDESILPEIIETLVDNIFNRAVVNW